MNDVAQQKCRVDRIREYLYADRGARPGLGFAADVHFES